MRRFFGAAAAVAALLVVAVVALQTPGAFAASGGKDAPSGKGIVYLIRGGLNIFSTGMDDLAETLRERGVDARSVSHPSWRDTAATIVERYRAKPAPVVIGGHSFGANAAILVAEYLGQNNIPVALVILFDPTERFKAPANVKRVVNFLSLDSTGLDFNVFANASYSGQVENIVLRDLNHLTIDNDKALQERAVEEIAKVVGASRRASTR